MTASFENPLASGVFCENCWTRLDDHGENHSIAIRECPLCGPGEAPR